MTNMVNLSKFIKTDKKNITLNIMEGVYNYRFDGKNYINSVIIPSFNSIDDYFNDIVFNKKELDYIEFLSNRKYFLHVVADKSEHNFTKDQELVIKEAEKFLHYQMMKLENIIKDKEIDNFYPDDKSNPFFLIQNEVKFNKLYITMKFNDDYNEKHLQLLEFLLDSVDGDIRKVQNG